MGWAAWRWWPNDETAIRQTFLRLVRAASIQPADSGLARLAYADRLTGFFTTNAVIRLDGLSPDFPSINGRADLREAAMAARMQLRQASFRLTDLNVTFPEDKRQAKAYIVITGQINSQTNQFGQAFKTTLRMTEGRWLISAMNAVERVE